MNAFSNFLGRWVDASKRLGAEMHSGMNGPQPGTLAMIGLSYQEASGSMPHEMTLVAEMRGEQPVIALYIKRPES